MLLSHRCRNHWPIVLTRTDSTHLAPEGPIQAQVKTEEVEIAQGIKANATKYTDANLLLEVNYDKPVYNVGKDFLHHVFSRGGYIDMMCRPWAPDPTEKHPWHPPSWMMTLRNNVAFHRNREKINCRTDPDPLVGAPHMKSLWSYKASGSKRAFERRTKEETVCYPPSAGEKGNLFLQGFILAEVEIIKEAAKNGIVPISWFKSIGWDPIQGGSPPPKFWRTLVGDRGLDKISRPPRNSRMACEWVFEDGAWTVNLDSEKTLKTHKCPSHVAEFLTRMQGVFWKRCLIKGRCLKALEGDEMLFGLAPHNIKKGDKIYILYGCSVPVILREEDATKLSEDEEEESYDRPRPATNETLKVNGFPVEPHEKWYRFIGECYVHDFMNGEVFDYTEHRSKAKDDFGEMEFGLR